MKFFFAVRSYLAFLVGMGIAVGLVNSVWLLLPDAPAPVARCCVEAPAPRAEARPALASLPKQVKRAPSRIHASR